jgi:hypothetical protein
MSPPPEYPNLEALMEAEEGQPHNDFRILARVVPPITILVGCSVFIPLAFTVSALFIIGVFGFMALAAGIWYICDRIDKAIPRSKARIRKLCEVIWSRYRGFANIVGVDPALSPSVAKVLDEAAAIYLKRATTREAQQRHYGESHLKALEALEEAMARMLQLGEPATVREQDLALAAGWAQPLLQEMREVDVVLQQPLRSNDAITSTDPLANLRIARLEIQGIETAFDELEENQSNSA